MREEEMSKQGGITLRQNKIVSFFQENAEGQALKKLSLPLHEIECLMGKCVIIDGEKYKVKNIFYDLDALDFKIEVVFYKNS